MIIHFTDAQSNVIFQLPIIAQDEWEACEIGWNLILSGQVEAEDFDIHEKPTGSTNVQVVAVGLNT